VAAEWYYSKNEQTFGPLSSSELRKMAEIGGISENDMIWKEGMTNWKPAKEIKGLFPIVKIPESNSDIKSQQSTISRKNTGRPSQIGVESEKINIASIINKRTKSPQNNSDDDFPDADPLKTNGLDQKSGGALSEELRKRKEQARETFNLYRLFWSRVLKSDFQIIHATQSEIEKLESSSNPVDSPLAQDYASWRRSLLMICILVLGITLVFTGYDVFTETFNSLKHPVIRLQAFSLFAFQIISFFLCIIAARNWATIKISRTYTRLAWVIQFAGPFILFFTPLSLFVSNQLVLISLGFSSIVTLAPKIFGLFPGLIRCSLSIKTLLPESSVPGWLSIVIAPIYILFLCVGAIVAIQTSFLILGIGLLLIGIGTLMVLLNFKNLLKPSGQAEASQSVTGIKRLQSIFQLAGIGLIGFQVFRNANIDREFLNNVFLFVFSFIGNVTLLTVAMSDFMLGMIREGQIQSDEFFKSNLAPDYQARLDQLAACGLTDLDSGEGNIAEKIRAKGMEFAKKTATSAGWTKNTDDPGSGIKEINDFM